MFVPQRDSPRPCSLFVSPRCPTGSLSKVPCSFLKVISNTGAIGGDAGWPSRKHIVVERFLPQSPF